MLRLGTSYRIWRPAPSLDAVKCTNADIIPGDRGLEVSFFNFILQPGDGGVGQH